MPEPKNIIALKNWLRKNRPDILQQYEISNQFFPQRIGEILALVLMGFEAGREFQHENPDAPLGPEAYL